MRKAIRGFPLLFLLLLVTIWLGACAATKQTAALKTAETEEMTQPNLKVETQNEAGHVVQQCLQQQEQTEQKTTMMENVEPVPEETSSMEMPTQSLLNLTEGCSSVNATRKGDNIVITGKCDSLARRIKSFEQMVFRQCSTIDSLSNVLLPQHCVIAEYVVAETARSGTTKEIEQMGKLQIGTNGCLKGFCSGPSIAPIYYGNTPVLG